jgi:hypothetical protein
MFFIGMVVSGAAPRAAEPALAVAGPQRRPGSRHLRILFGHSIFRVVLASWALHAVGGATAFNEEQLQHGQAAISVWRYATTSQFWFESMQNWQSEFIAVAAIVGLSIFLRQRGSAESKPVAEPNRHTGA